MNLEAPMHITMKTFLFYRPEILIRLKIYPNPVNDILYINGQSQKYDIEIYTLTGQRLYRYFNVSTIDMSLYDDGVYLIKIFDKIQSQQSV